MAKTTRSASPRRAVIRRSRACAAAARNRLDDMVAPVMREIRNPLAILVAASELLAEELGPRHHCSGYARLLRQTSDRCHEALSDLSILAMPGHLLRTEVDLAGLLSRCRRAFEAEALRAKVTINIECPAGLAVSADRNALELCLTRLFQQSLSAMPEGGELLVRVGKSGGQTVIRVADTGSAAPEDILPRIFEPFVIAGARRPEMRLAVCKSLVTAHGGRVAARNRPEGGFEIEIRLPSGLEKLN